MRHMVLLNVARPASTIWALAGHCGVVRWCRLHLLPDRLDSFGQLVLPGRTYRNTLWMKARRSVYWLVENCGMCVGLWCPAVIVVVWLGSDPWSSTDSQPLLYWITASELSTTFNFTPTVKNLHNLRLQCILKKWEQRKCPDCDLTGN